MNGSVTRGTEPRMGFEEAFREINGQEPTPDQVRRALALSRVLDEAALNPVLLAFLVDIQAQAAREQSLAELRQATGEVVERLCAAVPKAEDAQKSIGAVQSLRTTLENLTVYAREFLKFGALVGCAVGLVWAFSLFATWRTAYFLGWNDAGAVRHRMVCDDLNGYIAAMSAHWRKMGYGQAADRLGTSYDRSCR